MGFGALALLAASSGCGASGEDQCRAFVKAACDVDWRCAPRLAVLVDGEDPATCAERSARLCPALAALPDTSVDGGQLGACASDLDAVSCGAWRRGDTPRSCTAALRGALPAA
ncbi:MAG TPA: hypothetical protein VHB21_05790, partial [Minicystis sp.]|nr:hypothetical protein [Minicystis sp.]